MLILNLITQYILDVYIAMVKAVYTILNLRSTTNCVMVQKEVIPTMCSMEHRNSSQCLYVSLPSIRSQANKWYKNLTIY